MRLSRRALALGLAVAATGGVGLADDRLEVPPGWRDRLAALRAEPKFAPAGDYMGYLPEDHRARAEALVNDLIDRLVADLEANPSRAWLREQVKDTCDWFRLSDTEDRDRCALHVADILDALGIEATDRDGLDPWIDRFDPLAAFTHPQLEA